MGGEMRAALLSLLLLAPTAALAAPPKNVLRLVDQLREGESYKTRADAALQLGRSDDIRAREPLQRALADEHYAVRTAALRALVHLRDVRAIPSMLDLLGDDEAFVRVEARKSLARFPLDDARPYLITALARHADERVRLGCAERLAEAPTREGLSALLEATGEPGEVGRFAASVIASQPEAEAVGLLLEGLEHLDYRVQIASIRTLAEIGAAEATEPLITMLDSRVPEVTIAAADALRSFREHIDEKKYFVAARRSNNRFFRARALKVLGVLGGDEAATLLLTAMNDQDVLVRGAAIHGLSLIGDVRAIPKLLEMKKLEENARIITLVRSTLGYLERVRDGTEKPRTTRGPADE